jgi:hypothetical protein
LAGEADAVAAWGWLSCACATLSSWMASTQLKREELRGPVHLLHSPEEGESKAKSEDDQVEALRQRVAIESDALLGRRHVGAASGQQEHYRQGQFHEAALLGVDGGPPKVGVDSCQRYTIIGRNGGDL